MLPILTLVVVIASLCLLVHKYLIYPLAISPLSKLPRAHPLCSISEKWLDWQRKREAKTLFEAHQQHGPIVRLGPREVSVNSLEGLRHIYTAGLEKHPFYTGKFENYGTPNLVSMLDHSSHSTQKRMISSVYAKSFVQNSADAAQLSDRIILGRFLPLLQEYAEREEPVNVFNFGQWSGIDLMTAYLFGSGHATDFLRDKIGRKDYFDEWNRIRDFDVVGEKSNVEGLCMKLLRGALASQSEPHQPGESKGIVGLLLYSRLMSNAKSEGQQLTVEELMKRCASEMLDHIVAAHETLAITLTYVIYRMSLDPTLQTALRAELSTLQPAVSLHETTNPLPPPDKVDNLPLLNAVLQETLRLHAAVPGRLPRVVPAEGISMHGYYIPANTTVSCNAYSLHRHAETFPRGFEWLPQRWMSDRDRSSLGDQFPPPEVIRRWLWAFGSGGRMCIGSNYAIQGSFATIDKRNTR